MTSAMPGETPEDVQDTPVGDNQAPDSPAGDGDGPTVLARIDQANTFADADREGVCVGVCYTWARYARAGRLSAFVEAFGTGDPAGEVFGQITTTSEQVNQRLRTLRAEMQGVIDGNEAVLAQLRELKSTNAALAAEAQLPRPQQRPSLLAEIESANRRGTELNTQMRTSVAESTVRINEQIRLATLDPVTADPIAMTDGPLTAATTVTTDVRSMLRARPPGIVFVQLYRSSGGTSHLVGCEIGDDECFFLDPNTALFKVADVAQLADLFDHSWEHLYADDYNRYRVRMLS